MDLRKAIIPYDILFQYINGRRPIIPHSYQEWGNELVIVLGGMANFRINEQVFPVKRGDIFLLTGDYDKEITKADKLNICSIFYYEEHIDRSAALFRHLVGYQEFFIQSPLMHNFSVKDILRADEAIMPEIEHLLSKMIMEQQIKDSGYEQILNSYFFILITLIARVYSLQVMISEEGQDNMGQVMAYMRCHFTDELSLDDLAAMAHISPRHFSRKFKEMYRNSPMQYLRKLRLAKACNLLEQSKMSIAEISMECGFADINYFTKAFKYMYQQTPSHYRKAYKAVSPPPLFENLRPK